MGKRVFMTLIKKEHKLGDREYVKGKIAGFEYLISGCPNIQLADLITSDGDIITSVCYPRQYRKFKRIVRKLYPDLCEFDYKFKGNEAN